MSAAAPSSELKLTPFELRTILLVAAVQFINVLDFMMVMPLGPDFARALGIANSHLGVIGGSYTAAACVSGLVGALFLDRFDRRDALAVSMIGLVVGTALGGFAFDLPSLVAARVVAGLFGGPATSISLSIIADVVPPVRRGRGMGIVMMAFSVASVFGVPMGLKLAEWGSWKTPFFAVASIGLVMTGVGYALLPKLRAHLDDVARAPQRNFASLFSRPLVLTSYAMSFTALAGIFILVPNISAYVQFNLGYPRDALWLLYLSGGLTSLAATPFVGMVVDRIGALAVATVGFVVFIAVVFVGFIYVIPALPVIVVFTLFMLSGSLRNAPAQTVTSKVPAPHERAQFMSVQSAVQHLASASGAMLSSQLLTETAAHALVGIDKLAYLAIALSLVSLALMKLVDAGVKKQLAVLAEQARVAAQEARAGEATSAS